MKQHIFSQTGRLLILFSMFLSFFACQQDLQEPTNQSQAVNITKIRSAKVWFEEYQKSGAVDRSSTFKGMEVEWDKALVSGNSTEVPFKIDGKYNFPSLYNEDLNHLGQQRLVIYDDPSKGKMAYVFDYMPSMYFSAKIEDVHPNSLRSKKFDGMLALHTFDSDIVRGLIWSKGKIIKELKTQLNGVSLRDCSISSYSYACGRVLNGPLQCSTGYITICWTSSGGSTGGGSSNDTGSAGVCNPFYPGCGDKNAGDDIPEPPVNYVFLIPKNEYLCSSNFQYTASGNDATAIKQQAAISDLRARFEYYTKPKVVFGFYFG